MKRKVFYSFLAGSSVYCITLLTGLFSFKPLFRILKQGIISFIIIFMATYFLLLLIQILSEKDSEGKESNEDESKEDEGDEKKEDNSEEFSPLEPPHLEYKENSKQKRVD